MKGGGLFWLALLLRVAFLPERVGDFGEGYLLLGVGK